MVESRIERGDKIESEGRSYISSRALSAAAFRGCGAWSLGERKQAALGSPRDIRRGLVTPARRSRR
jgi:hypothetical protein